MTVRNQKVGRKRPGQKGSTLVESVLVLLTIVSMIVFIMDMGRFLLIQEFISERARATVRAAVVNNWASTQVANYLCYNTTTAPPGGNSTSGYLGLTPSQVTYTTLGTAGAADSRLQVQVSGVQIFTWIPYMAGKYKAPTITATFPAQSLGATS